MQAAASRAGPHQGASLCHCVESAVALSPRLLRRGRLLPQLLQALLPQLLQLAVRGATAALLLVCLL
jgi:hypothetical protein